ncbi:MAG: ATP-dependent RNA helicase HrpA [Phycisphaera sp.]|nr:MAG: ATP-dependent RNA helicase HrpA [Phycisphaera sp.]
MSDDSTPRKRRRRRGKSLGGSVRAQGSPPQNLSQCFGGDRRRIRALFRQNKAAQAQELIGRSIANAEARKTAAPRVEYPIDLPFTEHIDLIKEAISRSQVTVVCGETGSGKSTQLPKLLLEMGRGVTGVIGHTQPRRLAARAVADRVSEEIGCKLGEQVGYKVRFGDHTNDKTLIKLMTDGILLAETRSDRLLEFYDTIIIDEAHERSLNIDFLLGYLHQILPKRPDLKIVITSATIDADRFAVHFEDVNCAPVPILEISGRAYPVELRYRPVEDVDDSDEASVPRAVVRAIEELAAEDRAGDPGDVLVFLPGEREIREASRELRFESEMNPVFRGAEILPLYARLSPGDQQRIFRRSTRRRIVLSTNVAETSLTVPGIRYVIDSGLARMNRYSSRRKIQSLQIEPISKASARQRAGRCGRTEPGICVRLYSESDHDGRDEFTSPEILRTNLAGVILQMQSLGLGLPQDFPFVEPPDSRRINDAYDTLHELNAIDAERRLTMTGQTLARLPVDPRIGRILVQANDERVLQDALIVASFLEIRDPRDRPYEKRDAADNHHARFTDTTSDFLTVLRLWEHYHNLKEELSRSQLRKRCAKEYLSYQRLREWTDTHRQLRDMCRDADLRATKKLGEETRDALHRSVLSGSLTGIGKKHHEGGFSGSRGGRFYIHPSSGVKDKGTQWLVASELVRTTKLFARTVARIDPSWIESVAGHLIVREYAEPEYIAERGRVEARVTVTLFDLDISKDRLVDYGSVNRTHARQIFIEQALVDDQLDSDGKYRRHNESLIAQYQRDEAKLRRAGHLDREQMIRFFDQRLPDDVVTAKRFDRWRRKAERENPELLFMQPEDIGSESAESPDQTLYPDSITLRHGPAVAVEYTHDPGGAEDGMSIRVPLHLASGLDADQTNWLVPGWLQERVEAVLKGLPREIRRQFNVADVLDRVVSRLRQDKGGFYEQLASVVTDVTKVSVTPDMCRSVRLRDHLHPLIRVEKKGKVLWQSRDASEVVARARKEAPNRKGLQTGKAERYTVWPSDSVFQATSNDSTTHYPAILDVGDSVEIRRFDDQETAHYNHYFGVRRLAHIALQQDVRKLLRHTPNANKARVGWAAVKGAPSPDSQIAGMAAEYGRSLSKIRDHQDFNAVLRQAKEQLAARVNDVVQTLATIAERHSRISLILNELQLARSSHVKSDIEFQIGQLVHAATLTSLPLSRLKNMPRYLEAILYRVDAARGKGVSRDTELLQSVLPHWRRCIDRARTLHDLGLHDPQLDTYRWMIEEYRVQLFAQRLGTQGKINAKTLEEQWGRTRSL